MKPKICFCAKSIAWIMRHLVKSAKPSFKRMIHGDIPPIFKRKNIKGRKKQRTAKQKRADKKNGLRLKRWMKTHGR